MKACKVIVCWFCLMLLCLYLLPLGGTASAKTYTDSVKWYYEDGLLTIKGAGYVYGGSPNVPWDKYRSRITEIVISPGITGLANNLFSNCTQLTKVTLPDGLTEIGIGCFSGCSSLTDINFPDSLKSIDRRAFQGCSKLTSITIPTSMRAIRSEAFAKCGALKEVHIPSITAWLSITFEDNTATPLFNGADLLLDGKPVTEVTIPDGMEKVGQFAFYRCKSLTKVTLPDGITQIAPMAFSGCGNLKSISIPSSLQLIGGDAFSDCGSLNTVIFRGHLFQANKLKVIVDEDDPLSQANWNMPLPYLLLSNSVMWLFEFLIFAVPAAIIIIVAKKKGCY